MITIALLITLIILAIAIIVQNGIISGKLIDKKEIVTYINANFPRLSWYSKVYDQLKQIVTLTDKCDTQLIIQTNKIKDLMDETVRIAATLTNLSTLTEDSFKGTADIMNKVSPMIDRLLVIENVVNNLIHIWEMKEISL